MTDDLVTRAKGAATAALHGSGRDSRTLGAVMLQLTARIESDAAKIARLTAERDSASGLALTLQAECERLHGDVAAEAQVAELKQEAGMFLALWAVRHAEMQGLADGELHPQHYDRMAELGCRMDAFTRAAVTAAKGAK